MEPGSRLWIDARHQAMEPLEIKEVKYCFKEDLTPELLTQLYSAIGYAVAGIEVLSADTVNIRYDTQRVTPTFIDFSLQSKGLKFDRQGG